MRKIVVLSKVAERVQPIVDSLKSESDVSCTRFTYRPDIVEHITSNAVEAIVMVDYDSGRDIEIILRGVEFSVRRNETKIIILSPDVSKWKDALNAHDHLTITLVPLGDSIESQIKDIKLHALGIESVIESDVSPGSNLSIDMDFLKIFVDSTREVISQMSMDSTITHLTPLILSQMSPAPDIAIRSQIVIDSKGFRGSFFVCFPKDVFIALSGLILGDTGNEISDENRDLVLELANIVYGKAKTALNTAGYELDMKLPKFCTDKTLKSSNPIIVIPYSTNFGTFYIKVAPNLL